MVSRFSEFYEDLCDLPSPLPLGRDDEDTFGTDIPELSQYLPNFLAARVCVLEFLGLYFLVGFSDMASSFLAYPERFPSRQFNLFKVFRVFFSERKDFYRKF